MACKIKKVDGYLISCACLWSASLPMDMRQYSMALRLDRLFDYYNAHLKVKKKA